MREMMRKEALKRRKKNGFTLVELMVVIVIIGLLATIVALNVIPSGDTARVQKAKADIATIEQALEMYRLQQNNYPTTAQGLAALTSPPAWLAAAALPCTPFASTVKTTPAYIHLPATNTCCITARSLPYMEEYSWL